MQFGKIHGMALIILGALLLVVQAMILLHRAQENSQAPRTQENPGVAQPKTSSPFEMAPGILGVLVIGVGGFLALQPRSRRENDAQPAKTPSGYPM